MGLGSLLVRAWDLEAVALHALLVLVNELLALVRVLSVEQDARVALLLLRLANAAWLGLVAFVRVVFLFLFLVGLVSLVHCDCVSVWLCVYVYEYSCLIVLGASK